MALVACKRPPAPRPDLVGTWLLADVDGHPPESIQIGAYRAAFAADGTWTYEAQMKGGKYDGLSLRGNGTWSARGDRLVWTAGAHAGESTLACDGRTLTLDPDPGISPGGGALHARTSYHRER